MLLMRRIFGILQEPFSGRLLCKSKRFLQDSDPALQAAVEELSKEVLRRNLVAGLFKKAGIEMDYKFSKAS
jgi:hypothetical protein